MAQFNGLAEPLHGLGVILFHAAAKIVTVSQPVMAIIVPQFGGLAEPVDGLGIILVRALATIVTDPQLEAGPHMALLGGLAEPLHGLGVILLHVIAVIAAESRPVAGVCVFLFGSRLVRFLRLRAAGAVVCGAGFRLRFPDSRVQLGPEFPRFLLAGGQFFQPLLGLRTGGPFNQSAADLCGPLVIEGLRLEGLVRAVALRILDVRVVFADQTIHVLCVHCIPPVP